MKRREFLTSAVITAAMPTRATGQHNNDSVIDAVWNAAIVAIREKDKPAADVLFALRAALIKGKCLGLAAVCNAWKRKELEKEKK